MRLELEERLITWGKRNEVGFHSHMELVTVIGSNHFSLGDYITPDLFFQLQSLKEHM
ncbi:MAG: hypothetical protein UV04_C0042G0001, partial [Candidatus Gottesmanbacteria bacterium GW2011_GWA2_42_16]